jgi:hypothetical protein
MDFQFIETCGNLNIGCRIIVCFSVYLHLHQVALAYVVDTAMVGLSSEWF